MSERELQIWSELIRVPHGDIQGALEIHRKFRDENPLFYTKLASWYMTEGTVRDHKVTFVRALFEAEQPELRGAGWSLLQDLPFYLVQQVVMTKNPRTLRSAVIHYLASMDERALRYAILRQARLLKRLVKRLHIPTTNSDSAKLQLIGQELFHPNPVIRGVFKRLAEATSAEEVVAILKGSRVPPLVAISAIPGRTPEIMTELIRMMSPSELLQGLNSLGNMGYLKPNMTIIRDKLVKAVGDKRINLGRLRNIQRHLDVEVVPPEILISVRKAAVGKTRAARKLENDIAILFDTSGSQEHSIEAAKQIGADIAAKSIKAPLMFTCSTTPTEIVPKEYSYEGLEAAMNLLRAIGGTPLGSGLRLLKRSGKTVDTVILISDGGENATPFFAHEWAGMPPGTRLLFIRLPGDPDNITLGLHNAGIAFEKIQIDATSIDQYSIDQVARFIGQVSPLETVMEIMELPMPTRLEATLKADYWR